MNEIWVAAVAAVPAAVAAWAAYLAARRSASRDIAEDRAEVLRMARERAHAADDERASVRAQLLQLEAQFDRLRSVLRRLVDALDSVEPDHEALSDARSALNDLAD